MWHRDRTPRACVKQHRTHKGRSKFFASVSQQLLTTQTELLIGTVLLLLSLSEGTAEFLDSDSLPFSYEPGSFLLLGFMGRMCIHGNNELSLASTQH